MSESVETGGLMKFKYGKEDRVSKLGEREKDEIKEAYGKYDQRKEKEKRRKLMLILLGIIILVGGLLAIFLR
jgi:hypothetical protein